MSKYLYRIFTIIDLHFGAMQPCSGGLGMTLEASDFSIRPKIGRLLYIVVRIALLEYRKIHEKAYKCEFGGFQNVLRDACVRAIPT